MSPAFTAGLRALLALLAATAVSSANAQTPPLPQPGAWPQRGVRIVTPLPPGTGVDLTARLYADGFGKRWGQAVVVENRVGADGIMATASFVAARDDHTLLLSIGAPFTSAPLTSEKLAYDPVGDVTPIGLASEQYLALGVTHGLAPRTLAEFEALARADPAKFNWAANTGLPQLSFLSFLKTARLDLAQVTYRDSSSALNDLGEGRIHVYLTGITTLTPQLQAGKARLLAVLGRDRSPLYPDTPTVVEAGFPHMTVNGFTALFGWKGMAPELRDRIAADMQAVAADPAARQRFAAAGLILRFAAPDDLARIMAEQRTWIAGVLGRGTDK